MKRRIISLFMSLLMILSVFPVYALADTGTTGTDGEVTVTKELLSKEPDADGNYTIRLTVKGNPLSLETGAAAGDIVLVIDNSGSMTDKISAEKCTATRDQILENLTDTETKGKKDKKTYETYTCPECDREYTIIRDSSGNVVEDEVPDVCTGHINGKQRMEVAIDAGKEFAGDILEYNEYNRFAVIGFAGSEGGTSDDDAIKTTLGLTSDIDDINNTIDSMAAKGGTNYTAALNTALGILNGRSDEDKETRPGFVIFITDGAPGYSGDGIGDTDWDGSVQAQAIKDAGYTLYTVGLQLDSDSDECEYLESLASTPSADHFINIDSDNVEQELKDILAK